MTETREPTHDASDLVRLFEDLHPQSFGWSLSCCNGDADEAADVLQASYLKLLDGKAKFEGRSKLSTFLYGVIRRTAAERRRGGRRRRLLLERRFLAQPDCVVVDEPELSVAIDRLRAALAALPARQREVLHLVFYDELSVGESARVMGVGIGTARIHYSRGKRRLRKLLSDEETPR